MKGYEITRHDIEIRATRENDQARLREEVSYTYIYIYIYIYVYIYIYI